MTMTTEEKAKAYDEALERARKCWGEYNPLIGAYEYQGVCEEIFPELKESEDERIKQMIIGSIDALKSYVVKNTKMSFEQKESAIKECDREIAWLKKQGELIEINPTEFDIRLQNLIGQFNSLPKEELIGSLTFWLNVVQNNGTYKEEKQDKQKPVYKVKPKFKVGDWVVSPNGVYWHIDAIQNGRYEVTADTGQCGNWPLDTNIYHLWTIQDAKDGDVVISKSDGTIGIFQSIGHHPDGGSYNDPSYCFLHCRYDDGFFYADFENGNTMDADEKISPATKEQRDLLFQKMKEAGYEWDDEKKELKKCEQKPADWSEEDERIISKILGICEDFKRSFRISPASSKIVQKDIDKINTWLKSLKQRIGG